MGKHLERKQLCENLCGEGAKCDFDGKVRWTTIFPTRGATTKDKGSIWDCLRNLQKKGKLGEVKTEEAVREGKVVDLWVEVKPKG